MTDVTQTDMDRFAEAITKIVARLMPEILTNAQDFYVVHARYGTAYNLGTGRKSSWHADTIALVEATARREALLEAAAALAVAPLNPGESVVDFLTRTAWDGETPA